jgi:hypothetical protein
MPMRPYSDPPAIPPYDEAQRRIKEAREQLEAAQEHAAQVVRACRHDWRPPVYSPRETPGYNFAGDPPGTMGVDRQLPCYIPPTSTPAWTRTCWHCGYRQETQRKKTITVLGLRQEVPDFGD